MKRQIRVIGIDDSPFDKFKDKKVLVIGTIYRGGDFMDGLLSTKVDVDGDDATRKISLMIRKSRFYPHTQAVFLNGIAVAGFNVIDLERLHEEIGIPIITIIRKRPNLKKIKETLLRVGLKNKIKLIEKAPLVEEYKNIFFQRVGISIEDAKKLLRICIRNADVPESVRMAHIIGAGIIYGESRGKS